MVLENPQILSVLIVGNGISSFSWLRYCLQSRFELFQAASCADTWLFLERIQPALIIIDQDLLGDEVWDFCRKLRLHIRFFSLPVIILAEDPSHELVEQAFQAGAQDFVRKPVQQSELHARIGALLKRQELISRQEELICSLRERVERDPLTGFFNRKAFYEYALREIAKSKRLNIPIALMMIDIDGYKSINDNFGHLVGDEVLIELSNLIFANVRSYDIFARYGGDEFICLLTGVEFQSAMKVAQKLREIVAEHSFSFQNYAFQLTLSIGVATYSNWTAFAQQETGLLEQLISLADKYLYQAKVGGRNCVISSIMESLACPSSSSLLQPPSEDKDVSKVELADKPQYCDSAKAVKKF